VRAARQTHQVAILHLVLFLPQQVVVEEATTLRLRVVQVVAVAEQMLRRAPELQAKATRAVTPEVQPVTTAAIQRAAVVVLAQQEQ
jgi:hypothetical protein